AVSPQAALARFKNRRLGKETPLMKKIFSPRYRPAWVALALVALLAVSMTLPPVRAWAEGVLAQFPRVKGHRRQRRSDALSGTWRRVNAQQAD
ncbi:MAG: hypothetical protein M1482_13300, partial [Chloroflexi bacterium]|nr:hypothetical protein [Chloroflexota bacterium]